MFERLPLADFGNRIPQLSFEIIRPIGQLERMVRAVTLIPGTTEFGYEPATDGASSAPASRRRRTAILAPPRRSDVDGALDELQAICPALERVAIVVAWLRHDDAPATARHAGRRTSREGRPGGTWRVAGVDRAGAQRLSGFDGSTIGSYVWRHPAGRCR